MIRAQREATSKVQVFGFTLAEIFCIQIFNVTLFNHLYRSKEMTRDQISGFFKKLSKNAGVKISAHRFRHKLATDLSNKQRSPKDTSYCQI